jgi:hypothetical protein
MRLIILPPLPREAPLYGCGVCGSQARVAEALEADISAHEVGCGNDGERIAWRCRSCIDGRDSGRRAGGSFITAGVTGDGEDRVVRRGERAETRSTAADAREPA